MSLVIIARYQSQPQKMHDRIMMEQIPRKNDGPGEKRMGWVVGLSTQSRRNTQTRLSSWVLYCLLRILRSADLVALIDKHGFCPRLRGWYANLRLQQTFGRKWLTASSVGVYRWCATWGSLTNRLQLNTTCFGAPKQVVFSWRRLVRLSSSAFYYRGPHLESALTPSLRRRLCKTSASWCRSQHAVARPMDCRRLLCRSEATS